jgi:hypothetical protein
LSFNFPPLPDSNYAFDLLANRLSLLDELVLLSAFSFSNYRHFCWLVVATADRLRIKASVSGIFYLLLASDRCRFESYLSLLSLGG